MHYTLMATEKEAQVSTNFIHVVTVFGSCDELKARLSRGLQNLALDPQTSLLPSALSVRSCDLDDDGALNSVEFADCLQRMAEDQSKRSADTHHQRAVCFQRFMKEADKDLDNLVSSAELGRWSARLDLSASSGAEANIFTGRFDIEKATTYCYEKSCRLCDMDTRCDSNKDCSNGSSCIFYFCCVDTKNWCYYDC